MAPLRSLSLAFGLAVAGPVAACDLALALAVDVSGSVDTNEFRVQMDGLAAGLRDPLISEALVQAEARLMLVQWTGTSRQIVTIPWTPIRSFVDVEEFAHRVETDQRVWRNYSTAIGEALAYTVSYFDAVQDCDRHLIDVSGDGMSNEGISPIAVHPALRSAQITVNALAIEASEPNLTAYFFENVIHGEGAFVETAATFEDYPQKIRRKLFREIIKQTASLIPVDKSVLREK